MKIRVLNAILFTKVCTNSSWNIIILLTERDKEGLIFPYSLIYSGVNTKYAYKEDKKYIKGCN